ncbi:hypothetical protein BDA99DRAFT_131698 [Phascolomyces articulosus]|uniref:Uncharacterized protein n=1 Tax=Phascolomyces articulosus TaxID=60185 RepID=A0AAD5JW96_9FUNG|nr:hypothetical protein BDA99DRAFT_131698 [Phascolomyces articulosus]
MISTICRIPGRTITRSLITTQATSRFYSSSYRDNDRNSNGSSNSSNNKDNDQTNQVPTTQQQQQQQQSREQDEVVREQLSFMPVVNMPEAEFAHNAFFSLHRPLLGLSADEERPFFTSTTASRQHHHQGPNKIQKMLGIEQPKDEEGAFSAGMNCVRKRLHCWGKGEGKKVFYFY